MRKKASNLRGGWQFAVSASVQDTRGRVGIVAACLLGPIYLQLAVALQEARSACQILVCQNNPDIRFPHEHYLCLDVDEFAPLFKIDLKGVELMPSTHI